MDRTGLYGLFDLSGAPVDPGAAGVLGLTPLASGIDALVDAVDLADPGAVQVDRATESITMLLGRLDEPEPIAARLGLARNSSELAIARAALLRFGPDIRTLLHGEWTLAHWNGRALVLVTSFALRDPLYYAIRGNRIAISPDLRQLSRIEWIGDRFDPIGLLAAMGVERLRATVRQSSPIAGVQSLGAGSFVTLDREGVRDAPPPTIDVSDRWRGSFEDAMAEAEALMLRIVRQRMVGGAYACLVSGGLDSSTLGWLLAKNLEAEERLHFLTSAATPGSHQIDEFRHAAIVAAHLGIPHEAVIPRPTPGIYRPSSPHFRERNGPSLSVRHYLYDGFAKATRGANATLLFDGVFGEMTFTNPVPLHGEPGGLRNAARRLRTWWHQPGKTDVASLFHVDLARHRIVTPPPKIAEASLLRHRPDPMPSRHALWGINPSLTRAARTTAQLDLGRVRMAMPFRDPRLSALFASFPAGMLYAESGARRPARQLLIGKLPDAIRLRGKGPGIAPDYSERLKAEAGAARERIPLFRRAGADEWIDLEALDRGLERNGAGVSAFREATRTQLTALAGEFFVWWRGIS
ncbi:asparagine synthase-related protein [Sphingomonas sp.]|jgi:asparagine synthase (glutamine-hydrolysing)|uniref:asparagine synthase-related protein n=1 Tax=Sphingomonas sp. TaxID=28214 RepID=UPI002E10A6C3|nr:asparagine synthase-related protein [Sphingomonas sp.]HEV7287038.1 asparagine synthase-related protein [Sphingomonas sp.]